MARLLCSLDVDCQTRRLETRLQIVWRHNRARHRRARALLYSPLEARGDDGHRAVADTDAQTRSPSSAISHRRSGFSDHRLRHQAQASRMERQAHALRRSLRPDAARRLQSTGHHRALSTADSLRSLHRQLRRSLRRHLDFCTALAHGGHR